MDILKEINVFGNSLTTVNTVKTTSSTSVSTKTDCRILVDGSGSTITLNFTGNEDGVKIEVFAFVACTVRYYTSSSATSQQSMNANTSIQFIYHNGWKHTGMYDAVWN